MPSGAENEDLPAYVAIPDPRGTPQSSVNNWGPGFLPAAYQGTDFNTSKPIRNLSRPASISSQTDSATRDFLKRLNERHLDKFPGDTELAARISSYELAARMQLSVPEVGDLSSESATTLAAYGADDSENAIKAGYARNCILARRLIEKGVRFVQLFNGAYQTGGERSQQLGMVTKSWLTSTVSTALSSTNRPPRSCPISNSVDCSTKRSSCGVPNSVACRPSRKEPAAATTTLKASPAGSPGRASKPHSPTVRPTNSATKRSRM